jgi:membrane-associated HD superfamily phosphohydrolase
LTKSLSKLKEVRTYIHGVGKYVAGTFEGTATGEFLNEDSIRRRKHIAHFIFNCIFAFLVALVITRTGSAPLPLLSLRIGDVAEEDIFSPITAEIEPNETTSSRREDLARRVPPIFDYDDRVMHKWIERWKETFKVMRKEFYSGNNVTVKNPAVLEMLAKRVYEVSGQTPRPRDLYYLHENRFSAASEKAFISIGEFLVGKIIAPTDLFPAHYSTGIIVREVNQSLHETLVQDVSRIWSLEQAREVLSHVPSLLKDGKNPHVHMMVDIVSSLVVPNLNFNEPLTKKRIANILATSRQPILSLREGQIIIKKGERITEQLVELIHSIRDLTSPKAALKRFILTFIILLIFVTVLFRINITGKGFWNISLKDASFFFLISMITFIGVKFGFPYLKTAVALLNWNCAVEYLIPVSTGGIIIHLMLGKDSAYTYAFAMSIILGYMLDQNYLFSIWTFTVTVSAIQSIRHCKQRTDLFKCGMVSGLLGALLVLTFS